jgi:hypothetical protein
MSLPTLKSVFKAPESSVTVGLAQAAVIFALYNHSLPSITDIRTAPALDSDVGAQRQRAAVLSASLLGVVFLMTKDVNSLLIGGAAMAGIDLMVKHANGVHPATGKLVERSGTYTPQPNDTATPLPDYASEGTAY